MSYYLPIQKLLTCELVVNKEGFWRPAYQLTDGQYSYGMLRHDGVWHTKVIIETADQHWIIDGTKWKNRQIKMQNGEVLATISHNFWGTKVTFTANDGFTATFEKPSVWKGLTIWKSTDGAELVSIEPRFFKTPTITINPKAKQNKWILMLAFMALQLSLEAQKRAAAAAV